MNDRIEHYRRAAENARKALSALDDAETRRRCLRLSNQFARLADRLEIRKARTVIPIRVLG